MMVNRIISAPWRKRQRDCEFEGSLDYTMRYCSPHKRNRKERRKGRKRSELFLRTVIHLFSVFSLLSMVQNMAMDVI
jgi:hypothetical protein